MNDEFEPYEEDDEFLPSKSQLKRESKALQDLGQRLVEMPEVALKQMPMDEDLADAVALARRIHQRGGRKRQLQYIGKLLRSRDATPIEEAIERLDGQHAEDVGRHHLIEQWRDRLLESEDDSVLTELFEHYPHAERQPLRQLVRNARTERKKEKPPKLARELFRTLRELINSVD